MRSERNGWSLVVAVYSRPRAELISLGRYDSTSGGEREIQRTMLELLNQLDGFDDRGDVKVIMATNKVSSTFAPTRGNPILIFVLQSDRVA